jgi:hypothetical protein
MGMEVSLKEQTSGSMTVEHSRPYEDEPTWAYCWLIVGEAGVVAEGNFNVSGIIADADEEATEEVDQDGPISRVRTFLTRHPVTSESKKA